MEAMNEEIVKLLEVRLYIKFLIILDEQKIRMIIILII